MATTKTQSNPFAPFATAADAASAGEGAIAVMRAQAKMMDALLRQNIELLEFLKSRYEKDRTLLSALKHAENPNDMKTLWSGFGSRAQTD